MLEKIEEIAGHLGAILMQVSPKDDPIIIAHVTDAHTIAVQLLRDMVKQERAA